MNKRLEKFRHQLKINSIDGALIYSDTNRNYLSGFTGDESYIIITDSDAIFITDSRYTEQASSQVLDFEVRQYAGAIIDFLTDTVKSLGIKKLGFEEDFVTFSMYDNLKNGLKDIELVQLEGIIENMRQVKDQEEIAKIQKAADIADEAFSHMLKYIKPGMTEMDISIELEFFMRSKGASRLSFTSIVASGKRSSLPHGTASLKTVEEGDFLTLDFGCVYNGYCSDMTRTIVIGKASDKQKEIYDIVLRANEEVLKNIKPGITGESLDLIARNIIGDCGYSQYFGHGLGHGVGMDIHELPHVNKRGKNPLEPNMIITDEPGIYIPGFGGVRIEDLVVVTEDGCKVLSKSAKKLIEL